MYFPYFRGKEFEIKALAELAPLLKSSGRVIPILEPVRKNNADIRHLAQATQHGAPLIVIENPAKGEKDAEYARALAERLSAPGVRPGFLVGPATKLNEVEAFLKRNKKRRSVVIHVGQAGRPERISALQKKIGATEFNIFLGGKTGGEYREMLADGRAVILEDGFSREARNQDYQENAPIFFSDRFRTYKSPGGYVGFGDFLIVGDHFTKSGGGPLCVAIHLTTLENNAVMVRHFLSDRKTLRNVDTPGKFFEALEKTLAFIGSPQNWRITEACREFEAMRKIDFQGLGFVKKVSMKHHVELLDAVLSEK